MKQSETVLLRKELVEIVIENKHLKEENSKLESRYINEVTALSVELDCTKLENANLKQELDCTKLENANLKQELTVSNRRLEKYENSNAPSSTNSAYIDDRKKFQAEMKEKVIPDISDISDAPDTDGRPKSGKKKPRIGAPMGHDGVSHKNKAERTVILHVNKCEMCDSKRLTELPSKMKLVYDFPDDNTMRIECVAYVIEQATCNNCGAISSANPPTIAGTSFGKKMLGFILEYCGKRSTDSTIAYYFEVFYGFSVSANAIWNARKALRDRFKPTYQEILEFIAMSLFIQFDESFYKMAGKKGYVWLVTVLYATFMVATPSRAATVLETYFKKLFDIPVVVDGYEAYNLFPIRQRCWVHIIRQGEKLAIKKRGNYLICFKRLKAMYDKIKVMESASCVECMNLQKAVLEIAAAYKKAEVKKVKKENDAGLKFMGTITTASPHLFTFLRYPGMPPHNNAAELEIRDAVVLNRNVHHYMQGAEGMDVFSVLNSVIRTCGKVGIFPRMAVENIIKNPKWSIFAILNTTEK